MKPPSWRGTVIYQGRKAIVSIQQDKPSKLWRVVYKDGKQSILVNKARAMEAAWQYAVAKTSPA